MFHFPDTNTTADITKYATVAVAAGGGNVTPSERAQYNEGFSKRQKLLNAGNSVNFILPLNRFGFFDSFEDKISANGKVTIVVRFESGDNVIFRSDATVGRYIIDKFVLWVPKMTLTDKGRETFLQDYLKPQTWEYLNEEIFITPPLQVRSGDFNITNAIRKPRHVFVWVLDYTKLNEQEQNLFIFDTYNIANARTITNARLKFGNGTFYPEEDLDMTDQKVRAYRQLIQYNKSINDHLSAPFIDVDLFEKLYGTLYFDLTRQDESLKMQLIAHKHLLTVKQKQDTLNALQSGGNLYIKPTVKQRGGFLGTLLASIAAPLLLNVLTGQAAPSGGTDLCNKMYVDTELAKKHDIGSVDLSDYLDRIKGGYIEGVLIFNNAQGLHRQIMGISNQPADGPSVVNFNKLNTKLKKKADADVMINELSGKLDTTTFNTDIAKKPNASAVMLLDGSQFMTGDLNLGNKKAINPAAPSGGTDLCNKTSVDTLVGTTKTNLEKHVNDHLAHSVTTTNLKKMVLLAMNLAMKISLAKHQFSKTFINSTRRQNHLIFFLIHQKDIIQVDLE
ncbi:hypothetical protein AWC38_SpisGene2600 [Stylophora pistillata]|uniref:Uncharacterized protein n=1 Tax=Stylophora pistillata TaxID=50429 RepID=A0A2B4SVW5_STYPI|nr:hypothetical protein AWC38_SpisGene2600 [Stylophora pistillata]